MSNKFNILQELIPTRQLFCTTLPVQVKKSASYSPKSNYKKNRTQYKILYSINNLINADKVSAQNLSEPTFFPKKTIATIQTNWILHAPVLIIQA
ncbi:MAG: hypothetical protein D3919_14625 [Candidatus Electrothrix sp. AW5]|nr:hypothetical protein [Candidatus Electrothrix gigas]MCI5225958.1 hypothetical protein [Candidatus Electrothrix gigas]